MQEIKIIKGYGNIELNLRRRGLNTIKSIFPISQLREIKPKYNGYKIKNGLLYFIKNGGF